MLDANERTLDEQLMAANFVSPDGFTTPVGLLLAGNDVLDHLRGAYVQFLRFDGEELSDKF